MKSSLRLTKVIAILSFSVPLIASFIYATVKPTIPEMAGRSDIIVVGKVLDVDKPGEPLRKITIQVKEVIKGPRAAHELKTITLSYVRMGKGNIDFQKAKKEKTEKIFFLRFNISSPTSGEIRPANPVPPTTSFQLTMADAWFGMEPADQRIRKELKELERKAKQIYDKK